MSKEEKKCPLCAEEMDMTDQQFKPCNCGYQVCVWCWHHIMDMAEKDGSEGRCPACRTPYDKGKIAAMEANIENRVVANNSNRKNKPPKAKPKANEVRKDLTNVRVIQQKMAYVIGLPLSLADEDLLQQKEYFGQYGKVSKVSVSRNAGGAIQQFVNETCSVYVSYSKEEEAIRCIQSVHGFVLEDRLLRASFGTAKYCHAWLKNMTCTNPTCLYLHTIGAEEDSFGKDEVAAVHTRNRVEEVVVAAQNSQRRSGNVLPPPVDEPLNIYSASSNKQIVNSAFKDTAHAIVTSIGHMPCLLSSDDKDGGVRTPSNLTTFVDIVGRSGISAPEKDVNVDDDWRILNLCSEFTLANIGEDNHVEAESSDAFLCKVSSSSHPFNGLHRNKEWQSSNILPLETANLTSSHASVTKEQSCFMHYPGRQVLGGPGSIVREDLLSFDNQRLKDSDTSSQMSCIFPSSYTARISEDSSDHTWRHKESRISDSSAHRSSVHNHVDEASIQLTGVNSTSDDGYNEKIFQRSAKSDRIYRCSNSFSNEEIVEHLRRLDDDNMTNDDKSYAIEAVESSLVSDILSMNFDACDNSLTLPHSSTGLLDETDRQCGSSWNFQNSIKSGFSFVRQEGLASQVTDLDYSLGNIGQISKNYSAFLDSRENKEQYMCNPPYHVSRAQNLIPPGLSLLSREPPPGFSACQRPEEIPCATSRNNLPPTSLPNNHYQTASTGNIHNTSDVDLFDPAIMLIGRGKQTDGLNSSGLEMRPNYASQPTLSEDEARLWLLMHQDPKFTQIYMQQNPSSHQELRYSGRIGAGFSPSDDIYGISSRLMDRQQTYNPSSLTLFSPQKFANGHVSNGYQGGVNEVQSRSEVSMTDLQRNERLGFNKFYPGYGDLMFQMSSSGDIYTADYLGCNSHFLLK